MIHEYNIGGREIDPDSKTFIDDIQDLLSQNPQLYTLRRNPGENIFTIPESNYQHFRLVVTDKGTGELWGKRKAANAGETGITLITQKNLVRGVLLPGIGSHEDMLLQEINEENSVQPLLLGKFLQGQVRRNLWWLFIYEPDEDKKADQVSKQMIREPARRIH